MNAFQSDVPREHPSDHAPPAFGLLDIVEAFTSMRHEYRNQTMETRAVAEGLGTNVDKLDEFAVRIETAIAGMQSDSSADRAHVSQSSADENQNTAFAVRLAEIDLAVSRSIDAARRSLSNSLAANEPRVPVSAAARLKSLGPIARFFCRGFADQLDRQWQQDAASNAEQHQTTVANVVSGLAMTIDHVRRQLEKHGIERIDVVGQPFDGESMRAVEVVGSDTVASGHVAEQLSPAYRFRDRIILYADVRIARS